MIGVAADVISGVVWDGKDSSCVYLPEPEGAAPPARCLCDSSPTPESARRALDALLDRVAPAAILRVTTLDELFAVQIYPFRLSFAISLFLGGLALALTLSGIYGVLSFLVSQRTREIGIRMALGATRGAVTRAVLSQSTRPAAVGIAIGVLLSLGVSRLFASALEGINTFDPLAISADRGGVVAALGAAWFPSRRAAAVDPASTLRYD